MSIIPFDDRDGYIFYNGEFAEWRDAKVHVLNHGLHYASCVFEGERVYNGRIFKSKEHSERLGNSAKLMDFELAYSADEIDQIKEELVKKQNILDGYMRVFAFRGSEKMAISAQDNKIHFAAACWQWPSYYSSEARIAGLKLTIAKYRRPPAESAPIAAKAAGLYMICTISKHLAEKDGFNDALMLDCDGYIAESTGANFFLVMDNELHTPLADRFLNGITRQTVIELAKNLGIKVVERRILPEELVSNKYDAFITGSAAEITRLASVDLSSLSIGECKFVKSNITMKLIDAYDDLVRNG